MGELKDLITKIAHNNSYAEGPFSKKPKVFAPNAEENNLTTNKLLDSVMDVVRQKMIEHGIKVGKKNVVATSQDDNFEEKVVCFSVVMFLL